MILAFTVYGEPHRKERPRVTRFGTYTPKGTLDYEREVRFAALDIMRRRGIQMIEAPVVVDITIRLRPPPSMSMKRRAMMITGELAPLIGRADLDNYVKAVLDGMNTTKKHKGALKDDRLIVGLTARKVASLTPGVDVVVEDYYEWRAKQHEGHQGWPAHRGSPEDQAADQGLGSASGEGVAAPELGDPQAR